jgi:serine/threonine protein kinase
VRFAQISAHTSLPDENSEPMSFQIFQEPVYCQLLDCRQTLQNWTHPLQLRCTGYNGAHMALTSGLKLGPYEIVAPLGAGGMGEVYRAQDTRLDRIVAIKVLASHLCSSPEFKQRMEREARAISSLNHPNICHLYDIGSQDGADYLVMEFLEGET